MKGLIAASIWLFLGLFLAVGCWGDGQARRSNNESPCGRGTVYREDTREILTSVEGEFLIALESNPSTGYRWEEDYDGQMLELLESGYESLTRTTGEGDPGLQVFHFQALAAGETRITFFYRQPWVEEDVAREIIFSVDIR